MSNYVGKHRTGTCTHLPNALTEVRLDTIDPHGCKIYKCSNCRQETLIHNRTYGCPLG